MKQSDKIQTKIKLHGSTEKLLEKYGGREQKTVLRVSFDGVIKYTEETPLNGTKKLALLAASKPGVGVEFEYTTKRSRSALTIADHSLVLDTRSSTPLRPVIVVHSWYASREEHYSKVGRIKDALLDAGYLPESGSCQVTQTIDC